MQIPLTPPFSHPDLVAQPAVRQILSAALGPQYQCSYYNSNTAYPGSTYQPVHRDAGPIFGTELSAPTPATGIVMNVPLCDFTEENGSTEVWPGTHLIVDRPADQDKTLDDRIGPLASARMNVPAGRAVLRDLRVWHRGVPNRSDTARSMIAIVYKRAWLGWRHPALRVPASTWAAWPEHVQAIFAGCPRDPD
jgi:ectoine hydroxylase-related dioxygenase (phytanoyl-CoA dioxygenase family)